jgi:hypothetical protein
MGQVPLPTVDGTWIATWYRPTEPGAKAVVVVAERDRRERGSGCGRIERKEATHVAGSIQDAPVFAKLIIVHSLRGNLRKNPGIEIQCPQRVVPALERVTTVSAPRAFCVRIAPAAQTRLEKNIVLLI